VKETPGSFNQKDLREKLSLVLAPIISETEGLSLQVENGKVSLVKGEVPSLWFKRYSYPDGYVKTTQN